MSNASSDGRFDILHNNVGTIDVLCHFKLCAGCMHSEQLRVQRVSVNT